MARSGAGRSRKQRRAFRPQDAKPFLDAVSFATDGCTCFVRAVSIIAATEKKAGGPSGIRLYWGAWFASGGASLFCVSAIDCP